MFIPTANTPFFPVFPFFLEPFASDETMLNHFPAAGQLLSTLIIKSTCFSLPPSLLIPLPRLCSVAIISSPLHLFSISAKERQIRHGGRICAENVGETQLVQMQDKEHLLHLASVLPSVEFFHFGLVSKNMNICSKGHNNRSTSLLIRLRPHVDHLL